VLEDWKEDSDDFEEVSCCAVKSHVATT
jgi:hypothetical protein